MNAFHDVKKNISLLHRWEQNFYKIVSCLIALHFQPSTQHYTLHLLRIAVNGLNEKWYWTQVYLDIVTPWPHSPLGSQDCQSERVLTRRSGWEYANWEKSLTTSLNVSSPDEPSSDAFICSFKRLNRSLYMKTSNTFLSYIPHLRLHHTLCLISQQ